ncbi:Putative uncharacterized protein [Moritella viscosa]|nr:Putative uncharacterized protein [Moritella viscosa]
MFLALFLLDHYQFNNEKSIFQLKFIDLNQPSQIHLFIVSF